MTKQSIDDMKADRRRMVSDLKGKTDTNILSVDINKQVDVLLAFGGPTVFFRFIFNADGDLVTGEYHNSEHGREPVYLTQSELEELEPYVEAWK